MELQLGLGLPGGGNCKSSMIKQLGFDLNNCFDHHDQLYNYNSEGHHHHLVFAASCSSVSNTNLLNVDVEIKTSTKRSFDRAFDHDHQLENSPPDHVPQTLPLLVWTTTTTSSNLYQDDNIINEHDDHDLDTTTSSSIIINKNELGEVESGVIGWPPVKSSRKNLCHQHKHGGEYSKSMFVKAKMEGVGIARKVDLTLHASYHTLTSTLMAMFGKCQEDVKSYNLTYQDKEGDWLLAGDVPWGSFIETVQRLKLLKKGG